MIVIEHDVHDVRDVSNVHVADSGANVNALSLSAYQPITYLVAVAYIELHWVQNSKRLLSSATADAMVMSV